MIYPSAAVFAWGHVVPVEKPSGRTLRISLNGSVVRRLASLLPMTCTKKHGS